MHVYRQEEEGTIEYNIIALMEKKVTTVVSLRGIKKGTLHKHAALS